MNYPSFGSRRVRGHNIRSIGRNSHMAGRTLAMRRRWYADDDDTDTPDDPEPGAEDDEGDSDDADDDVPELLRQLRAGEIEPDIAYQLISEARAEAASNRKAKKDLKALQDAQAAAKQKKLEDQNEFKKLWEDAQPKLARLQELESQHEARLETVKERNEARLKELSKDNRAVVDGVIETAGTDDPDKISAILDTLLPTLTNTPKPPDMNGGAKGDGKKQSASGKVKLNKANL